MQLRSTTIKHKRYSAKGWRDLDANNNLKNTLSQGEIGVLLSPDLQNVLEVRIGIKNNSSFYEGVLLGNNENIDVGIKPYDSKINFPSIGNEYSLYIAKDTSRIWRWDDENLKYYCVSTPPGQGDGWWNEINGGKARLSIDQLGTSTPIDDY